MVANSWRVEKKLRAYNAMAQVRKTINPVRGLITTTALSKNISAALTL